MARSLEDHLFEPGKKRILAIDGGGARGILAVGIIKEIERILAARLPMAQRSQFRLHQYFDLIGGTSTGSILAAGLCIGLSADDLEKLYLNLCPKIFARNNRWGINVPKFDAHVLEEELVRVLREKNGRALAMQLNGKTQDGEFIKLNSRALHTGFAVFAKRIDKGSPWTLTNNPRWRYFDRTAGRAYAARMGQAFDEASKFTDNGEFALARLIQASAAAPTFFRPVDMHVEVEGLDGHFVDGAISGRNTPALQMLMMAKLPAFGFEWKTTEDDLLMISVGTGWYRPFVTEDTVKLRPGASRAKEAYRGIDSLMTMIHDSSLHALTMMQGFSRYPLDPDRRWKIDGEIEHMLIGDAPFLLPEKPLLHFRRMDVRLEDATLQALFDQPLESEVADRRWKPPRVDQNRFRVMGAAYNQSELVMRLREMAIDDDTLLRLLNLIGARYAATYVDDADFPRAFDPPGMGAPDGRDTVEVLDPPTPQKRMWF
jgi:predicted acylesterase/phospholipase RssA